MKITRQQTDLWIKHAIAHFQQLNKTQKDLAKELGIEESRLSEMKKGSGTLTTSQMESISELCGAPNQGKGRYEELEIYDTLDSFFEWMPSVTKNRYLRSLIDNFNNKETIANMGKELTFDDGSSVLLVKLCQLVLTEQADEVFNRYNDVLTGKFTGEEFCWSNDVIVKDRHYMKEEFPVRTFNGVKVHSFKGFYNLYLLWFVFKNIHGEEVLDISHFNLDPCKNVEPVVILGKCVWCEEYNSSSFLKQINIDALGNLEPSFLGDGLTPDKFKYISYELYLSSNMNYHLVIHLGKREYGGREIDVSLADKEYECQLIENMIPVVAPEDRAVLIPNVHHLKLFPYLDELRKWCCLPQDSYYELKKKLAREGGYIPGAKIIN